MGAGRQLQRTGHRQAQRLDAHLKGVLLHGIRRARHAQRLLSLHGVLPAACLKQLLGGVHGGSPMSFADFTSISSPASDAWPVKIRIVEKRASVSSGFSTMGTARA